MPSKLICPLRLAAKGGKGSREGKGGGVRCVESDCAWWGGSGCIVLTLSGVLDKAVGILEDVEGGSDDDEGGG